jgi:hypothetical protein
MPVIRTVNLQKNFDLSKTSLITSKLKRCFIVGNNFDVFFFSENAVKRLNIQIKRKGWERRRGLFCLSF